MPSKFGGIPIQDDQQQGSKFGGVPVGDDVPGMEKMGGYAPPAGQRPTTIDPGSNPLSVPMRALLNLPRSLHDFGDAAMRGLGPTAFSLPANAPTERDPNNPDADTPVGILGMRRVAGDIGNIVRHPLEALAEDPIGTVTLARTGLEGGRGLVRNGPEISAAAGGAAKGAWKGATAPEQLNLGGRITGGMIGHHFGGYPGALIGQEIGARVIPTLKGVVTGAREGLAELGRRRAFMEELYPESTLPRLGPARSNMPGAADASRVVVMTGDPLSYPGPRLLSAPAQEQAPFLGDRRVPEASVTHGNFASGPQIEFVPPSENLSANPRALKAAEALRGILAKAVSNGSEAR